MRERSQCSQCDRHRNRFALTKLVSISPYTQERDACVYAGRWGGRGQRAGVGLGGGEQHEGTGGRVSCEGRDQN